MLTTRFLVLLLALAVVAFAAAVLDAPLVLPSLVAAGFGATLHFTGRFS